MRIALAGSLVLVLFAIAMLVFIKNDLEQAIYSESEARVQVANNTMRELVRAKGRPTLAHGSLRLGTWLANDDNSLVDHVRALTGADATLFAVIDGKPIRVSTTIVKLDGSGRNVRTELVGPARAAYDAGRGFSGVSAVAGRPFLNRYDLLRDARGKVIGIIYTGIPLTHMSQAVGLAMREVILGTLVGLLVSLTVLYFVMRPLRRAFRNAVTIAQGLAAGDVEQQSNNTSDDELGKVSLAFSEMIAYQQRMACIADALAAGDFSHEVVPASPRDRLGIAFAHMSDKLSGLIRQLEQSAMTDSLTQLGNRRAFDARMRGELSRAARHGGNVWLALVDVDNFKAVNDQNGHQHGDVVLSKLATVLRHMRAEDSAYRLGGDEFAIVFLDSSDEEAKLALERVRNEAQEELFGTTISVGLANSPLGLIDAETLQRKADAALYVCKKQGRNNVVSFNDAHDLAEIPQQMNVHAVTRLIAERQLDVAFQPIWNTANGSLLGLEALARPDGKYGLSGPQESFDVAAKIGRARDLDTVCREVAISRAGELPPNALLFLNVAPETLAHGELVGPSLAAALADVGLTAERVVLEITESYGGAIEPVIAAARELQRFGFKLALDDTGAGNAGLDFLSRLKVDFIKIDGGVIAKAVNDVASRGVIAAIVALAKTTNAYVIAEGIEDQAMLDGLRRAGAAGDHNPSIVAGVQGYFLGRPGKIATATENADAIKRLICGNSSRIRSELNVN